MTKFNDIARGLPGIPRSTLSTRLKHLEATGIVERGDAGSGAGHYSLTKPGQELKTVIHAFGKWGASWALDTPLDDELDPGLLLWRMQYRLNADALPKDRVTISFDFQMGRKGRFWFVINDGEASVCLTNPGFDVTLYVSADLSTFMQVWLGRAALTDAVRQNKISLEGLPAHERGFASWFLWSPMAQYAK